jgi:hypothetical protein
VVQGLSEAIVRVEDRVDGEEKAERNRRETG